MKTESLSTVMLEVLKNNRQVAKSLIEAYRTRATRLIENGLASRLGSRGRKLGDVLVKRIDRVSDSAEGMMVGMCNRACGLVEKMDDGKYAAKYLGPVGKAMLPGAKIVRNLSGTLAARIATKHRVAGAGLRATRVKHRPMHRKSVVAA
jgi:hypothetical protein